MSISGTKKYWLSTELCTEQISDLVKTKKLVKYLIEENATSKEAWDSNLMNLLCEYHTHVYQMLQFMLDVMLVSPVYNQEVKKKEYLLQEPQGAFIKGQANLLKLLDLDLRYNHGISFTMH